MNELDKQRREALQGLALSHLQSADNQFKWIVGTLVVLNGGALLALINIQRFQPEVFGSTGWAFMASIVLALVSGVLYADSRSHSAQRCFTEAWSAEPLADDINAVMGDARVNRYYMGSSMLLVLAFAAFIVGVVMASLLPSVTDANELRAELRVNKQRMISARAEIDRLSKAGDSEALDAAHNESEAAVQEFNQISTKVDAYLER